MHEDLDRRAGKAPEDDHPLDEPTAADPSDDADLRVTQPGEDPPGEDAMGPFDGGRND